MRTEARQFRHMIAVALVALLPGCLGGNDLSREGLSLPLVPAVVVPDAPLAFMQCVPYAREVSGIQIYGDAWTWWNQAGGRYARGKAPQAGAVLALKRTNSLQLGHVAVVARVMDSRKILVDHANWGDDEDTRGKIHTRQPVIDVSPKNDWSAVRFMNIQGTYGRVYPAHGFIYGDPPPATDQRVASYRPR